MSVRLLGMTFQTVSAILTLRSHLDRLWKLFQQNVLPSAFLGWRDAKIQKLTNLTFSSLTCLSLWVQRPSCFIRFVMLHSLIASSSLTRCWSSKGRYAQTTLLVLLRAVCVLWRKSVSLGEEVTALSLCGGESQATPSSCCWEVGVHNGCQARLAKSQTAWLWFERKQPAVFDFRIRFPDSRGLSSTSVATSALRLISVSAACFSSKCCVLVDFVAMSLHFLFVVVGEVARMSFFYYYYYYSQGVRM